MKNLAIIFCFLGLYVDIFAQQAQSVNIFGNANGQIHSMQRYASNKVVAVGVLPNRNPFAILLNTIHQTERYKSFRSYFSQGARMLEVAPLGNGFFFTGSYYTSDTTFNPFIMITDGQLNPLKLRKFFLPANLAINYKSDIRIRVRRDGQYIWGVLTINRTDTPTKNSDFLLMKWDKNLNLLFSKTYDILETDYSADIEINSDAIFISSIFDGDTTTADFHSTVSKIDKQGNLLWTNEHNAHSVCMTLLPDGNVVVAGAIKSESSFTEAWLMKIDQDGTKVSENTIGSEKYDIFRQIITLPNGNLLLSGNFDQEFLHLYDISNLYQLQRMINCWIWRYNADDLSALANGFHQVSNSTTPTVLRDLVALNDDGTNFIGMGTRYNSPYWYSYIDNLQDPSTERTEMNGSTSGIFPNVATSNSTVTIKVPVETIMSEDIFYSITDASGRNMGEPIGLEGSEQPMEAPQMPGTYYVVLRGKKGYQKSFPLLVVR